MSYMSGIGLSSCFYWDWAVSTSAIIAIFPTCYRVNIMDEKSISCAELDVCSCLDKVLVHGGFGWTSETGRHDSQLLTTFESFRGLLVQNFHIVFHCLIFIFLNSFCLLFMLVWCYFYSSDSSWRTELSLKNWVPDSKDATWVCCLLSVQVTCQCRLCIMLKWLIAVGTVQLLRSLSGVPLCPKRFTSYLTVSDSNA